MALQRQELRRVFLYSGVTLPDPDPALRPEQVRDLLAAAGRPDLSSAEIRGPETVGDELHFTFHRAVGTKGYGGDSAAVIEPPWTGRMERQLQSVRAGFQEITGKALKPSGPEAAAAAVLCAPGDSHAKRLCPPSTTVSWVF